MRRLLTILALAGTVLAVPAPASAHTVLVTAAPGPGDKVAPGVRVVALTFRPLRPHSQPRVAVTDPAGTPIPVGRPLLATTTTVCASVAELRQAGVYAVAYEAEAADGDYQRNTYYFQIVATGHPVATPPACQQQNLPPPVTADPITAAAARQHPNTSLTTAGWVELAGLVFLGALTTVAVVVTRIRRRSTIGRAPGTTTPSTAQPHDRAARSPTLRHGSRPDR